MRNFRGKRIDNGEWIRGHHFRVGRRHFIISLHCVLIDMYPKPFIRDFIEVIPESVGQSIEFKFVYSKEVYDGDIILYPDTDSHYVNNGIGMQKVAETKLCNFGVVVFKDGSFGLECYDKYGEVFTVGFHPFSEVLAEFELNELEVIGNTTDDKHLLEKCNG